MYVLLPLMSPFRPFTPHTALGRLLAWEREMDSPATGLPSFHVVWVLLAADVYASRSKKAGPWAGLAALMIAASCVATSMHSIADILGAFTLYLLVREPSRLWSWIRAGAEWFANIWHEWRIGPVRVINHGAFAGAGVAVGALFLHGLTSSRYLWQLSAVTVLAMGSAGLFAQWLEGSSKLLRPFGYYGGLFGVLGIAFGFWLYGGDPWLLLGASAIGGSFVQGIGRLRCLGNGCCHGAETSAWLGIRYRHPAPRPSRMAGLRGKPIHATQVYSLFWCLAVGLFCLRLWSLDVPLSMITGLYLILNGIGRFVEESFRGEPQTHSYLGLKVYQWLSMATVGTGAWMTTRGGPLPPHEFSLPPEAIALSAGLGLLAWIAMGVDLPASNKRFARLT
jgi:hypothetical protein